MRLRLIIMTLSLLVVLSASIGGYLYYSAISAAAFNEAERQAGIRLEVLSKSISTFLLENTKVVRVLAGMEELLMALVGNDPLVVENANAVLDHFNEALEADVCYLMNPRGYTVASSNRYDSDSFVGQNFSFRPYFKNAVRGWPTAYLALGVTSGKRGIYTSYPIYANVGEDPVGVVVVKSSIEVIENRLGLTSDDIVLVTDPNGVIFISNRGEWLFQMAWKVSPADLDEIAAERQFGTGPWEWIGLEVDEDQNEAMLSGERYLVHQVEIEDFPGWKVIHLRSFAAIAKSLYDPFIQITGPIVLLLCLLIGAAVFILYRKAIEEIAQRRRVESALRDSEERYRSLYHNTPAMLHSIDVNGRLLSVSNYWVEALGYARGEVVGRKLTDFMTEESRRYAETEVLPAFFKSGFCKDVGYQYVRKGGGIIDILLSAIADRAADGRIVRTLAVSIDVTDRKRAEFALEKAKEELSRYSKNLERQVEHRTREIGSILKYTPAVVYFKDIAGRYLLVNSRYEELFNVTNESVRGRTDYDVLPKNVADQFRRHDLHVLAEKCSRQVEERIPQQDGEHTYLSVKFPVYDERGNPSGVCGIATDITAVKKAQDQLRRLSGSILANQEIERAAIARELHDELGQVLTALRMDAVWIQKHLKGCDTRAVERSLTMCRLIDKTIEDVRSLAFRLRPGILDDLGLVEALELYTTDFEKRTGITCVFDRSEVPVIHDAVATAAYRITQETLTNVARHAHAGHVIVKLFPTGRFLTLEVVDDGKGFDMADLDDVEGLGLAGMRERAVLVGGRLEICSVLNQGTRVSLKVPFEGMMSA
jgi:PAS domain S-box-containing protein